MKTWFEFLTYLTGFIKVQHWSDNHCQTEPKGIQKYDRLNSNEGEDASDFWYWSGFETTPKSHLGIVITAIFTWRHVGSHNQTYELINGSDQHARLYVRECVSSSSSSLPVACKEWILRNLKITRPRVSALRVRSTAKKWNPMLTWPRHWQH